MNHSEESKGVKSPKTNVVKRDPAVHRENANNILKMYREGYSTKDMMEQLRLTHYYITSVMKALGIQKTRRSSSLLPKGPELQKLKDSVRDMRLQGMSNPYISSKLGLTSYNVIVLIQRLRDEGRLPKEHIPYSQQAEIDDALKTGDQE